MRENRRRAPSWCLVVPVKRLAVAKSRLQDTAGAHRGELALAFAADTVTALLRSRYVLAVVAVTDDPLAARVLGHIGAWVVPDEPGAGLNPALRHGAGAASARYPGAGIGALSADLPALRTHELSRALELASGHDSAVVADRDGIGTTAYFATRHRAFRPAFGPGSFRAHAAAGAHALHGPGLASLRHDVDTGADLDDAAALGFGAHTIRALDDMHRDRSPG